MLFRKSLFTLVLGFFFIVRGWKEEISRSTEEDRHAYRDRAGTSEQKTQKQNKEKHVITKDQLST